ncbi:1-acyl-sn-glycerol-3-phosphate acyltransferase [Brucepastera parasyntrophica]|uniref:1-acyl-sn-glycerol-3-phosphate acyltransferase n=1 Tax=Brucepastera parasyntrophica TaxID=2880008 RepID=UPI00210CAEE6|nr:1-acyl-sn-glycerol-3-phosphate acyltransferase [Brucepastera parasyntrophica]ULQ58906.1 1-acyl-sn-glycerol-3-phosphate acyltransferase [Brucepastera parasyntrophica]
MHPDSLAVKYRHYYPELKRLSRAENVITADNVYQPANLEIRKIMDAMCEDNMLPESEFRHLDYAADFLEQIKAGKRGIILMEHYSNFDLPGVMYLLDKSGPKGKELESRIVTIAGMKLNEENPYVSAFAEAYSRIIIYPSRALASIKDPELYKQEEHRSRVINLASMRALEKIRKEGNAILVFPSGTRFRPGMPETKRGVREIDSYIRLSDIMMLVSINGNCLTFSDDPADMMGDIIRKDKIIMTASPVYDCIAFREEAKKWDNNKTEDKKQMVVDYVMYRLEEMHEENEKGRLDGTEGACSCPVS